MARCPAPDLCSTRNLNARRNLTEEEPALHVTLKSGVRFDRLHSRNRNRGRVQPWPISSEAERAREGRLEWVGRDLFFTASLMQNTVGFGRGPPASQGLCFETRPPNSITGHSQAALLSGFWPVIFPACGVWGDTPACSLGIWGSLNQGNEPLWRGAPQILKCGECFWGASQACLGKPSNVPST
jgi:hypothetical protein